MAVRPINIRLTGRVAILDDEGTATSVGGRQAQILVAMLVMEGGSVAAERVAEVLWGDDLSDHWRGALRGVVSKLRNVLSAPAGTDQPVTSAHGTIRLEVETCDNVSRAEALITSGQSRPLETSETDELRDLSVGLHHPFLIHNDSTWADNQRRRIDALADHAEHTVLEALRRSGRLTEAIAWADHVIARDPVDVLTREALTWLHLELGDIGAARRAFEDLERLLTTEFGHKPEPELTRRIRALDRRRLDLTGLPVNRNHPDADEPFIGRGTAVATIVATWERVQAQSQVELVVIRGPAGVGKSRLADHALEVLAPHQQLWGRARPAGGHTWGPIADALAEVFAEHASLAHLATVEFPSIGRLLPELDSPGNDPAGAVSGDAPRDSALAVARQIIHDLLARPTVLVIDDLQWAGPDGLALIETVLTDTHGPLLAIATCREITDPVAAMLETVARRIRVTELAPDSFDLEELTQLARDHVPAGTFTTEEIEVVHHRTGGLPYFACALLREARVSGVDLGDESVPDSVALWLESFLKTLTTEQRRMLEVVAVLGSQADLAAVEAIVGMDAVGVADTLDELAAAGLVTIDHRGQIRIPHDLTIRAVWQSTGSARRAVLHRLAGDHLATRNTAPAIVAGHWSIAGPARREQAVRAHLQAGELSLSQGAWRAGLTHFATVRSEATDPETQIAALIGSGRALINLREHDQARRSLEQACDLAERHGYDQALAEATLLLVGRAGRGAIVDDESAQLTRLRRAHKRLLAREGADDDPQIQILLAGIERELAISLLFVEGLAERRRLLHSSLARIRASPEASANDLAKALLGQRMARIDATDFAIQIAELDEALGLPHAHLEADVLIAAHVYRHEDLLRTGRHDEASHDLVAARAAADVARHAYWQWAITTWEALGSLMAGSFGAAEIGFTLAAAARPNVSEAMACHQVNLVTIRLMQERGSEVLMPLQDAVKNYPNIPTWRAALALTAVESGHDDLAAELLDAFVETNFGDLPEDTNRFFALGILAHVAAGVGSVAGARQLWDLLVPFRGHLVLLNVYGGGGSYWGPVEWALARIATLLEHPGDEVDALWDDAVDRVQPTPVLADRITREARAAAAGVTTNGADPTDRSGSTSQS